MFINFVLFELTILYFSVFLLGFLTNPTNDNDNLGNIVVLPSNNCCVLNSSNNNALSLLLNEHGIVFSIYSLLEFLYLNFILLNKSNNAKVAF